MSFARFQTIKILSYTMQIVKKNKRVFQGNNISITIYEYKKLIVSNLAADEYEKMY